MGENPTKPLPTDFEIVLNAILDWFSQTTINRVIIGGVAASLLGKARLTKDIDALVKIDEDRLEYFLQSGSDYGIFPRQDGTLDFARKRRVLLLVHKSTGIRIDISLAALPFEDEAFQRAQLLEVAGMQLPLPSPEDLIIMKAVANRPIDQTDIENILVVHPNIDQRRIRKWVRQFADVLEMPEIYENVNQLLKKKKRKSSPMKRRKR